MNTNTLMLLTAENAAKISKTNENKSLYSTLDAIKAAARAGVYVVDVTFPLTRTSLDTLFQLGYSFSRHSGSTTITWGK